MDSLTFKCAQCGKDAVVDVSPSTKRFEGSGAVIPPHEWYAINWASQSPMNGIVYIVVFPVCSDACLNATKKAGLQPPHVQSTFNAIQHLTEPEN